MNDKHLPQLDLTRSLAENKTQPYFELERVLPQSKEAAFRIKGSSDDFVSRYKVGYLVTLFDENKDLIGKGVLRSINTNLRLFLTSTPELDKQPFYSKLGRWWSPNVQSVEVLSEDYFVEPESEFSALLEAFCRTDADHKAGLISWSLYYKENENDEDLLILRGNDLNTQGICRYEKPNCLWASGIYTLKAVRYSKRGGIALKQDGISWVLNSPRRLLACGGYHSVAPSLYL